MLRNNLVKSGSTPDHASNVRGIGAFSRAIPDFGDSKDKNTHVA